MGCGQSIDPAQAPDKDDTDATPVEPFDVTTDREDTPMHSTTHQESSRQPRQETIASSNKQRDDSRSESAMSNPPVGSPGSPGFASAALNREQALPNPFETREPQPAVSPEGVMGVQAGYVKQKDTKKRGGFDPEKFRQANGRGGLVDAAPAASGGMQPQMKGFSTQNSQSSGYTSPQFSTGNNNGVAQQSYNLGQRGQQFGGEDSWQQGQQFGGESWSGSMESRRTSSTQQWGANPNYISAPEYSNTPQMLDFNGSNNPPPKQYGALGWDQPRNEHSFQQPSEPRLTGNDEQELDDILQEIGDL